MKKFEFLLYINGNIICQRYFSVKGYNKAVNKSLDIVECVNECVALIQNDLKEKSEDFLWYQFNPYKKQTQEEVPQGDIYENEDIFEFEIRVDGRTIAKRGFTGNVYPQRVRYSVDIRKIIPSIIGNIQDTFSRENFDVEYCGIEL
ncbi:MAG: hypothetical protein GTO02_02110 [Candidatus Dadabacteria bacterium]|nr:hypothetical protein [Candidatus Dadabacteria bacterium]NIQ13231.1 hypothetical protein [Candidatus Dadabacteria bacterium]